MTTRLCCVAYHPGCLPRGVTHVSVARAFAGGESVHNLAWWHQCSEDAIEAAIRGVLRRQDGIRPFHKVGPR